MSDSGPEKEKTMQLYGKAVSTGCAVGKVYIYNPYSASVSESKIDENQVAGAVKKYEEVQKTAETELRSLIEYLEKNNPDKAKIFAAHLDILYDEAMEEEIIQSISENRVNPQWAVESVYEKYICILSQSGNSYMCERAADLTDVKNRLLRCFDGVSEKNLASLPDNAILAAKELLPSDTAALDRKKVSAILTEVGGSTSHSAILARSYGIPAVLGINRLMEQLIDGTTVLVDAIEGTVIISPTQDEIMRCREKISEIEKSNNEDQKYLNKEASTKEGNRIEIHLNMGGISPDELAAAEYVDGVGLFRTEFLYMGRESLPTEEEQFETYKKVLQNFGDKPVTIRTLDIGGDKKLPYMKLPVEDNPFLGLRGIRLCLSMPEIFKTQLRALLRAAVYGNLWIMLPMVEGLEDVNNAKACIEEVKTQLTEEKIPFGNFKLGIMVEVPAIALVADKIAEEADFASIGSNDLTQYCTAVDRQSTTLGMYDQPYHPALFRLIGFVIRSFEKAKKPVCICGELGGDPLAAAVLVGLGIKKISVGVPTVPRIKRAISRLDMNTACQAAEKTLELASNEMVEKYLHTELSFLLK